MNHSERFFQTFRPKPLLLVFLVLVLALYPAMEPTLESSDSFEKTSSLPVIPTRYEGIDPVSAFWGWLQGSFQQSRNFFQEYVGHVRPVWADSSGPRNFATFANVAYGVSPWGNPNYAVASDNSYATNSLSSGQTAYYLKATKAGFAISSAATINGIYAEFERGSSSSSGLTDSSVKIVKAGSISGTDHSAGATWAVPDTYVGFGGSTDLWGLTWTPADINADTFGVAIACYASNTRTAYVDHIRITVYYTLTVTITWALSGVSNDATGTIIAIDGTNYVYADFPKEFSWTIGSTKSVTATDPVPAGTGKQYDWTQWTNGDGLSGASGTYTVPGSAITVTAVYATQWYLTVTSTYGSPTGQAWYTSGNSASSSVTSPVSGGSGIQYVCTGWTGTGSAPASGSSADTGLFTMSAVSSVTWSWKTQYEITFTSSGIGADTAGTVVTLNATAKTQAQLPYTAWYNSTLAIDYAFTSPVAATAGKRYVWSSTSGLSQTLQSNIFVVTATGTVTGTYHVEWEVTVSQSGLGVDVGADVIVVVDTVDKVKTDLPFVAWYDNAVEIDYEYTQTITGGSFQYSLVTVSGCGMTTRVGTYTVTGTCTLLGNYGVVGGTATVTTTVVQTTTTGTTATATTTTATTATATVTYTSVTVAVTLTSQTITSVTVSTSYTSVTQAPLIQPPIVPMSGASMTLGTWSGVVNQSEVRFIELPLTIKGQGVFLVKTVQVSSEVAGWITLNETKMDSCACYKLMTGGVSTTLTFRIAPGVDVAANLYDVEVYVAALTEYGQGLGVESRSRAIVVRVYPAVSEALRAALPPLDITTALGAASVGITVVGWALRRRSQDKRF